MTTSEGARLRQYIACHQVVSMVQTIRDHRDLGPADTPAERAAGTNDRIVSELVALGLDFDRLAIASLEAVRILLLRNSDEIIRATASLLWQQLGDPERGGQDPPEAYNLAATSVFLLFVGLLDPTP